MRVRLNAGGATDAGRRPVNEDSHWIGDQQFILADGVGGSVDGGFAAEVAVSVARDTLVASGSIRDAVRAAHDAVRARAPGGATTLMVVQAVAGTCTIASVGDCAAYRLDGDDELAVVLEGSDVSVQPVIGQQATAPEPSTSLVTLRPGDRLLMCTDGVHRALGARSLVAALQVGEPEDAARSVVQRSVAADGSDNSTAIVIDAVPDRAPVAEHVPTLVGHLAVNGQDAATTAAHDQLKAALAERSALQARLRVLEAGGGRATDGPAPVARATGSTQPGAAGQVARLRPPSQSRPQKASRGGRLAARRATALALALLAATVVVWCLLRVAAAVGPDSPTSTLHWRPSGATQAELVDHGTVVGSLQIACPQLAGLVAASRSATFDSEAEATTWLQASAQEVCGEAHDGAPAGPSR